MAKRKQASKTALPASAGQLDGPRDFPIVGIGASAGGLKAFEAFLRNMPADSGMAFVLVQHLDPTHESKLAELLQNHSEMPVRQVDPDTLVEPNHVYVIPPDKSLTLTGGTLRLGEREPPGVPPVVIDQFFRSLAHDHGARAVGVVLSGTGNEGAQGLGAIKEAGGITLAQDEADAEYGGMPHNAVAAGFVDLVLPVAQMPAKLLEVKDHAADFKLSEDGQAARGDEGEALRQVYAKVRHRTGHDFSHYKKSTVLRRLDRRMQVGGFKRLADYLSHLRDDPAEAGALFREFLISVSNFFRDQQSMAVLERKAIPELLAGKESHETVRVWVPACASGQEAYTLAMLLSEARDRLERPPQLQLFATDVDEEALQVARHGHYPGSIATDVSPERLKRFFDVAGAGYRVKASLREMILFTRHDLLNDPPFSSLDLVSCRNLLIYLDEEIQPRVFGLFHFALKPGGYLFLGSSESLGRAKDKFAEVDRKARLFQRRLGPAEMTSFPINSRERSRPGPGRDPSDADQRRDMGELARRLLLERYAPPCVVVDGSHAIRYVSGHVGGYLELAPGEPTQNILEMAREGLGLDLRTALHLARTSGEGSARRVRVRTDDRLRVVDLIVEPIPDSGGLLLVAFEDVEAVQEGARESEDAPPKGGRVPRQDAGAAVIDELEADLKRTKKSLTASIDELETANAELRAANEELQSLNEELQSTGEELETSKEELQSSNEELSTVNQELRNKVEELSAANSVLDNLIASTDVATLFLDSKLQLRRYTPKATDLFHLIPGDIGRPLAHIAHRLGDQDLQNDAQAVNEHHGSLERELQGEDGDWFLTRILPYRTALGEIDGVVVTLIEITERTRAEQRARAAQAYAEAIVDTVREPLVVLDATFRVLSASAAFYRDFQVTAEQTEGSSLFELGAGRWDNPELRTLLSEVLPRHTTVEDFELHADIPDLGRRTILLNARRIHHEGEQTERILLSLEDVTEARKAVAERRVHDLEVYLAESMVTERRRIGRDIHDGLVQNLVGVRMLAANLVKQLATRSAPETVQMKEFADLIGQMNSQVRDLMNGLAPVMIGGEVLIPALERAAANIEEWYGVLCSVSYTQPVRLERDVTADHLYHIAREAMTNAAKHAKCSQIEVSLSVREGTLTLTVHDDGIGMPATHGNSGGTGVTNMRNRAELIGATLDVRPGNPGGTVVICTMPGFENGAAEETRRPEGISHR